MFGEFLEARFDKQMRRRFEELAGATGLEPAASAVTGRRSNQLNYAPAKGPTRQLDAPA
jgi:hypothetical protein